MIDSNTFSFLKELAANNNRDWFTDHKATYDKIRKALLETIREILDRLSQTDEAFMMVTPQECIFRINRDIRFSKDKSPYKTNLGASISPAGRHSGGVGYYLHIEPGASFMGGGMYMPSPAQLATFREAIEQDATRLKKIIFETKPFVDFFGEPHGEKLQSKPKGYEVTHPEIDLLRYKQMYFSHSFSDEEIASEDFVENFIKASMLLKPFNEYLLGIWSDLETEK